MFLCHFRVCSMMTVAELVAIPIVFFFRKTLTLALECLAF